MAGAPAQERGIGRSPAPAGKTILLPLASALLFSLSFPNDLFLPGIGPLSFFCLLPFFLSLRQAPLPRAALSGALFGAASYALFNAWAFRFHWLAAPLIMLVHASWIALLALFIPAMMKKASPMAWLGPAALWTIYEWLKSSGWSGYPYGVLGYSQYLFPPLARSAGLWGVWGISFLLAATSAYLSLLLWDFLHALKPRRGRWIEGAALLGVLLALTLIGAFSPSLWTGWKRPSQRSGPTDDPERLEVLLVQPNFPARKEGALPGPFYADRLLSLTKKGLEGEEAVELIVMPETAFPPALEIRLDYPPQDETDFAARRLLRELGETGLPAILGNGRSEYGRVPGGGKGRRLYNSALFLESGRVWASQDKRRLVPFIEDFPSPPLPLAWREAADAAWGPLWTRGEGIRSFELDGFRISTPICFEDCFGSDCRELSARADLLLCLASDAWAGSEAARRQHLACAAFRPLENGKPLLRATNDGVSALILPDGSIRRLCPSSEESTAKVSLPKGSSKKSPYQGFGDWFPLLCILILAPCLPWRRIPSFVRRMRRG